MACSCGLGETIAECCGPVLEGERLAATAEELARARYTAYSLGRVDFLVDTAVAAPPLEVERSDFTSLAETGTFVGLEILGVERGTADDIDGVVEYAARYLLAGQMLPMQERARFQKVDGEWRYVFEGGPGKKRQVRRAEPKIGRNDACPCGSGKKYKRCHG